MSARPAISAFDDLCLHQTPDYIRVPGTTDRNFYDRYFFCGYHRSGAIIFGIAFGRYPNRHVQDAHFSVAVHGQQNSLHASQPLASDPSRAAVGELVVDPVDPMRRVRCHGTGEGLTWDLMFLAESGAIDEGRLRLERDGMTFIDQTRFMQWGRWEGWIEIDGVRHSIDSHTCFGLRDKSWGVRLFAENHTTAEPGGQIFWMNVVTRTDHGFSVIRALEDEHGQAHERTGYYAPIYASPDIVPIGETKFEAVSDWRSNLEFANGTRRISAGDFTVTLAGEEKRTFRATCDNVFFYAGIGYNHEKWNHGLNHGTDLVVEREDWELDAVDMRRLDRQFLLSVVSIEERGKVIGFGHTEQLLMGAYRPFGWKSDAYAGL